MKEGTIIRYSRGVERNPDFDMELISTDEEQQLSRAVLIPAQILDLGQIETVTLNGTECIKK